MLFYEIADHFADGSRFVSVLTESVDAAADEDETIIFDEFVVYGLYVDSFFADAVFPDPFRNFFEVHRLAVLFYCEVCFVTDVFRSDFRPFCEPQITERVYPEVLGDEQKMIFRCILDFFYQLLVFDDALFIPGFEACFCLFDAGEYRAFCCFVCVPEASCDGGFFEVEGFFCGTKYEAKFVFLYALFFLCAGAFLDCFYEYFVFLCVSYVCEMFACNVDKFSCMCACRVFYFGHCLVFYLADAFSCDAELIPYCLECKKFAGTRKSVSFGNHLFLLFVELCGDVLYKFVYVVAHIFLFSSPIY